MAMDLTALCGLKQKRGKMAGRDAVDEVRRAALVHARLLDSFIQLTEKELVQQEEGFVEESLRELLDLLRTERRTYGTASGVVKVMFPSVGNAA